MSDARTILVTVGGFLGAGKTSLILAAARMLAGRGISCAAIFNDQAGALVDAALAREHGLRAGQVTGGCFCCRFSDLAEAAARMLAHKPEVIFAEPVGSCTDIAATVLQPLHQQLGSRLHIAPFTVLIDPAQAAVHDDPDLRYLFHKQIEEADLVCSSKSDLGSECPFAALRISARTGEGLSEWLQEVLAGTTAGGSRLLDIDYQRYAQAEAALAWLNVDGVFHAKPQRSPAMVAGPLLDALDASFTAQSIAVTHCKLLARAATGYVKAAICAKGREPDAEGDLCASPAARHELLLNVRALGDPALLRAIVEQALAAMPGRWEAVHIDCFRPSPPQPTFRVTATGR